MPLRANISS